MYCLEGTGWMDLKRGTEFEVLRSGCGTDDEGRLCQYSLSDAIYQWDCLFHGPAKNR